MVQSFEIHRRIMEEHFFTHHEDLKFRSREHMCARATYTLCAASVEKVDIMGS